MKLEFEVHNQTLRRVDANDVVGNNKNVYTCKFTFTDSEWDNLNKFVIFKDGWGTNIKKHLGKEGNVLTCLVPGEVLEGTNFKVSIYGGDLITTNSVKIDLIQSGYDHKSGRHHCDHRAKDIFVEIFDRLDTTIDSIVYENNYLHLLNQNKLIDSVYLPFLDEDAVDSLLQVFAEEFRAKLEEKADKIHRHENATSTDDGFMSSEDKMKLDGIEEGANHIIVDDALDTCSTNPLQNRIVTHALNGKKDDFVFIDELDQIIQDMIGPNP